MKVRRQQQDINRDRGFVLLSKQACQQQGFDDECVCVPSDVVMGINYTPKGEERE